jgi:Cupin
MRLLALALLIYHILTVTSAPISNDDKIAMLVIAASAEDRIDLLSDDEFVFDFLNPPAGAVQSGADGRIISARRKTFPALVENGVALSVGILGPCGLNTPHTHPRAAEFNLAVNGTLRTGMLLENGVRFVTNTLAPGQSTIFPQGAIHFEQNMGCDTIMFLAAFSNEDPGTSQVADRFFSLPSDIVEAAMGNFGNANGNLMVQNLQNAIPANVALGTQQCLQMCGLQKANVNLGGRNICGWKYLHTLVYFVLGWYLVA